MAQQFLLTMKLKTQGAIKGSSKGSSGKTQGPLDYSKGMQCHGFSYVKEVDSASPLLWQALCSNEGFTTATLQFAKPSPSGKPAVKYTIELTDGLISEITRARDASGKPCEHVSLTFEKMTVNGLAHGIVPYLG
jgi:type VI secretion system Hcp family effector